MGKSTKDLILGELTRSLQRGATHDLRTKQSSLDGRGCTSHQASLAKWWHGGSRGLPGGACTLEGKYLGRGGVSQSHSFASLPRRRRWADSVPDSEGRNLDCSDGQTRQPPSNGEPWRDQSLRVSCRIVACGI